MNGPPIPPQPLDVVAWVTVRLHSDGTLSTQGTIGDKRLALHLLDQAKDAIKANVPDPGKLIIPNRDVDVSPALPVRELGMMAPHERGDP